MACIPYCWRFLLNLSTSRISSPLVLSLFVLPYLFVFLLFTDCVGHLQPAAADSGARAGGQPGDTRCSHCGQRNQWLLPTEAAIAYSNRARSCKSSFSFFFHPFSASKTAGVLIYAPSRGRLDPNDHTRPRERYSCTRKGLFARKKYKKN